MQKPKNAATGKNCLPDSQSFLACAQLKNANFFKKMCLYNEVFQIMQADEIRRVAKSNPIIILYRKSLTNRHKRVKIKNMVSNKMRALARLKIVIQKHFVQNCIPLFDILKPEHFQAIIGATRVIFGYNSETKTFKAPSLVHHMGTNIKFLCDIARKLVIEKRNDLPMIKIIKDSNKMKSDIKELKELLGHSSSSSSSCHTLPCVGSILSSSGLLLQFVVICRRQGCCATSVNFLSMTAFSDLGAFSRQFSR